MRRRDLLYGAVGTVATAIAIGLVLVPEFVESLGPVGQFVETIAAGDSKILLLVTGLAVTSYVMWLARSRPRSATTGTRTAAQRRFERVGTSPPEAVTAAERAVAASSVDGSFEAAVENGGAALHDARAQLATAAAGAYAVTTGQSREAAREAVARGSWTDDPVAAKFLASGEGRQPPVSTRIRLWLRPRQERRRRIEATVAAIERLEEAA